MRTLMTTDGSDFTSEHHLEDTISPRTRVFRKEFKKFGYQYTKVYLSILRNKINFILTYMGRNY